MSKLRAWFAASLAIVTIAGVVLRVYRTMPTERPATQTSGAKPPKVDTPAPVTTKAGGNAVQADGSGEGIRSGAGPLPAPKVTVIALQAPVSVATVASPPSPPVGTPQPAEVRSTRAMYMAHEPLRFPEVADPDSEANRRILQIMVEKALNRQNSR